MMGHIRQTGAYFHAKLEGLKAKHACVQEIRGMGLMLGMNLDSADTAKAVVAELLGGGILINRTQDTVLRFLPPYIIQRNHVDQVIRALDLALSANQQKKKVTSKPKRTRRSTSR
jgi:acetylornithine/N-succinyldiaminopimelate aminotransferase